MIYRNRLTGNTVDVNSALGGDWEPVAAPKPAIPAKTEPAKQATVAKAATPAKAASAAKASAKKATPTRAASAKKAPPRKTTRK